MRFFTEIGRFAFLRPPLGDLGATYDDRLRLIGKRVADFLLALTTNCQRQSCKAFMGLTNCAKIIGGGRPLVPEILDQSDRVGAKSPIFNQQSLVAPNRNS